MFFRKIKELQSLVNARTKSLKIAEDKIQQRDRFIQHIEEANNELRFENDEQKEVLTRIAKLVNSNKYNNEKAILDKIKELASDYQSIN